MDQESLGGRTKTCIVATVSPSSLCLEETLSTLGNEEAALKHGYEKNFILAL